MTCRLRLAALLASCCLATRASAQPAAPPAAQPAAPTVVIIVRHAEKAAAPAADPPLTEAGVARAKTLASVLADANVRAVISTPLTRTRETARPTADARGLTVELVPLAAGVGEHAAAVASAVRRHAGQTVLVVGHK